MRYPATEKLEIIRLVEQSHLPARQTLDKLGIPRPTFYRWYDRYLEGGPEALEDRPSAPSRVWNRIPAGIHDQIIELALDYSELSPRELAVRSEAFAAHPLVFICPPGHELLRLGHPPVSGLMPFPFIVREQGSGTRNAMAQFFSEHRFEPHITMEMGSNETIKQAVMAGMGVSFLSLHTVGLELKTGLLKLLDVEGTPVMRTWQVVHLQSKVLSPAAEAFRYFLIEHAESVLHAQDEPLLKPPASA